MGGEGFEPSKLSQQIYSLPPLAARESTHIMENDEMVFSFLRKGKNKPYFCVVIFLQSLIPVSRNKKKADDRTRTDNLLITSQLLCQLSHIGILDSGDHLLSQAASHQVPSTAQVLTVVFGMGTGVSPERIITGNS